MKTILMTMTALAAISVAAPASAQPWSGQRSNTGDLQLQIDAGLRSGAISRREAMPLQTSLRELLSLERQFSRNGFNGRENAALRQRSNQLRQQIRLAEREGYSRDRRAGWDGRDGDDRDGWRGRDDDRRDGSARWDDRRDGRDQYGSDARFDRPNRGDRFAGDARVGHPAGMRMVALPDQYRNEFRDSDDVYYRFDGGRIYRINRATNMILGLFDI
jgi:hypothetical protein